MSESCYLWPVHGLWNYETLYCLYCWLSQRGLDPQKSVIKRNTATDYHVSPSLCQLSRPRTRETKQGTEQRWGAQEESRQQPDEVYLTDPTIKSRLWLARQPEAVTLAKGSLIIIIIITGLFISPPCFPGLTAPAPFHSCFFIQPASLHKWCSVLPKSKS